MLGIRESFGDKLTLLVTVTTGLAIVVVAATLAAGDLLRIRPAALSTLSTHADVIAIHSTAALTFNDEAAGAETLSALRAVPQIAAAALYDRNRRLFATFLRAGENVAVPDSPEESGHRFEGRQLRLTQPVIHANQNLGELLLLYDLDDFYAELAASVVTAGVVGLVAIGLALLLARQLRRGLARPIEELSSAAARVSLTGNYSVRATIFEHDELGRLTDTFNNMLTRIERYQSNQVKAEKDRARYTAELERSNRELDEFAYVASHDLRSPLQGIRSLATWISEDNNDLLPAKSRRHLVQMKQRVVRLEKLLNDLLQYSRAGRVDCAIAKVDTRRLCEDVFTLLSPPAECRLVVADGLPVFDTAKVPLEQVFRNLINNAIKHHDRQDCRVEIDCEIQDEYFAFSVADDGPGIEPRYHKQIMRMFETLAPRDSVEGSGMGLAVIKKIVEGAGGELQIFSEGRGTRFTFTWPRVFRTGDT